MTTTLRTTDIDALLDDRSIPAADRALWSLLRDRAGRLADLLSLDVRDVDLEGRTITHDTVRKLNSDAQVERFSPRTAELLRAVLADSDDAGPLFRRPGTDAALPTETAIRRTQRLAGCSIHAFRVAGA